MRFLSQSPSLRSAARRRPPATSNPAPFTAFLTCTGSDLVLSVSGEIDCSTVELFDLAADLALAAEPRVTVDLKDTTFMGADGARVLQRVADQLGNNVEALVVRSPSKLIRMVLRVTGVERCLTVVDS